MDPVTAVERALPLFRAVPPGDWGALHATLARAGIPRRTASEVSAFMPVAFGRELMDGMGVDFSPEYASGSAEEVRVVGLLASHPVYAAAAALAARMVENRQGGADFVSVALWSSEFTAVNDALNAGSNPADLVAGPPVIVDDGPSAGPPPETQRPWWRPWG